MADEQVVNQQAEATQEQVSTPSPEAADLTSRVSEVSLDKAPETTEQKYDRNQFNEKLAALPPEMQEQVRLFQHSVYKGAEEKFQEAARLRQEAELARQRGWDKDSVQQALQDPTFVQQINQLKQEQQVQENPEGSGLSNEEWSYLSPKEKALLYETRKTQLEEKAKMNEFFQRQEWEKQDLQIKSRYKNYDPRIVDNAFNGLRSGQVQATREDLWKAIDYENAVKRAYELGKKDRALDLNDKVQASSPANGLNVTQSKDVPLRANKESGIEYFKRLALQNAKKLGVKI